MDENKSDENEEYGDEEESADNINETLHGKSADNLAWLTFNYET